MWHNNCDYLRRLQKERHIELLRQAREYRLARLALGNRTSFARILIQPRLWLGRRMIAWGQNLVLQFEIESGDIPAFSLPSTK